MIPASRSAARDRLQRTTEAIRTADPAVLLTIGLHMEDLEQDRMLRPGEAAEVCDFLTMHGYPIYAQWAEGPTDERMVAFLALLTRWLGKGQDVLFSEFGLPTYRRAGPDEAGGRHEAPALLVEEQEAAAYTHRALNALRGAGCIGAMVWCYSDYVPAIWVRPPLDEAAHERFFGLWRADGSPKPSVEVVEVFGDAGRMQGPDCLEWTDIEPEEFWENPARNLSRLHRRYRESVGIISP